MSTDQGKIPLPSAPHCDGSPMTIALLAWEPTERGATLRAGWRCEACGVVVPIETHYVTAAEPKAAGVGVTMGVTVRTGAAKRRGIHALAAAELRELEDGVRTAEDRARARELLEGLRARLKEVGYTRHDEIDGEIDTLVAQLDAAEEREAFIARKAAGT